MRRFCRVSITSNKHRCRLIFMWNIIIFIITINNALFFIKIKFYLLLLMFSSFFSCFLIYYSVVSEKHISVKSMFFFSCTYSLGWSQWRRLLLLTQVLSVWASNRTAFSRRYGALSYILIGAAWPSLPDRNGVSFHNLNFLLDYTGRRGMQSQDATGKAAAGFSRIKIVYKCKASARVCTCVQEGGRYEQIRRFVQGSNYLIKSDVT